MPEQQAHRAKAKHNQGLIEKIGDEFADWLVIAAFYKAVHIVEMLRAVEGQHSRGHYGRNGRNTYLETEHPSIWVEYFPIYNLSIRARYYCTRINVDKVRSELVGKRLPALERLVEAEMQKRRRRRR